MGDNSISSGSISGRPDGTKSEGILRWIGDLDHPFYQDERNRFVWYEASAIAFQLALFLSILVAGLMVWIGGNEAVPYATVSITPVLVSGLVFLGFTARHRAEYTPGAADFKRFRMVVFGALALFWVVGMARANSDGSDFGFGDGSVITAGVGLGVALLAGIFAGIRMGRKGEQASDLDSSSS